jgi:hypothetical protein
MNHVVIAAILVILFPQSRKLRKMDFLQCS